MRECLYNLQHEDYDNSLVKGISWMEVAGEDHASGNEQAAQCVVRHADTFDVMSKLRSDRGISWRRS